MKKLLILLFLSTMVFSCDTEDCTNTQAEEVYGTIVGLVRVLDQHDNRVAGYPVSIGFQKWWCDGSYAIWVENQGNTRDNGEWEYGSPLYSLFNEEDYILVRFTAGTGDDMLTITEKISYNELGSWSQAEHNFEITL